jgi:hypothetical protein
VLIDDQPRAFGSHADVGPLRTIGAVPDAEPRHRGVGERALDGLSRLGMLGLLLAPIAGTAWLVKRVLGRRSSSG